MCHSLSLASVKSRLVLPFWYRLTWVVLEKGPLNGYVCVHVHGSGQGASYGGYGQPMSSSQPATEVMEPSQQQLTQSTYQGPAAAVAPSVGGATSGGSGQAPSAGYVGQQPTPAAQQQQTFNPNSRLVCCTSDARKVFAFLFLCSFCFS